MTRILIDLRCLETASATRGLGRHTRELVSALREQVVPGFELAGLSWSGVGSELGVEDVSYTGPRRGIGFADPWLLPRLFERERIALYHAPAYALPVGRVTRAALVLTVHDLVADVRPQALSRRHRAAFRRTFRSARVAHRVVAVSEATRRDLLARYPLDPQRVRVIPNGVSHAFRMAKEGAGATSGFPAPFLLYVGGLDPLKNVPFLLKVLEYLRREPSGDIHLVVAGEEGARQRELAAQASRLGLGPFVHLAGHLEDRRLGAAYREATAFVFPSRYEGFGLPPLEAMACGCPVVSSPEGALSEVLGEAAWLLGPDDLEGWARAVLALAREPALREERIRAGRKRASEFTWERTARETWALYVSAMEEAARA